jgi:hypothetical protein
MGWGADFDELYWNGLAIVGLWLVVFFYVRLAALAAISLIGFKWAILQYSGLL